MLDYFSEKSTALSKRLRLNGHSDKGIPRKQLHLPEPEFAKLVMDRIKVIYQAVYPDGLCV